MKEAMLPAMKALKATWAKSDCLSGAIVAKAAIWVPIEPGLANPHKENVAIVSDRFYHAHLDMAVNINSNLGILLFFFSRL